MSCAYLDFNLKRNSFYNFKFYFKNTFLYLNLHPKPGSISTSSFPVPFFKLKISNKTHYDEVNWLPGGVLILRVKDLVMEDYFPFEGKAYCEDLIHSFFLKKKGLKLYI